MTYYRREFYTKDLEIQRYMDSLMKYKQVDIPPKKAQEISRYKTIKNIRDLDRKNPYILIGEDTKCRISTMRIREPVKIIKIGNKYVFSL
jgi:hypothetical protein